MDDLKYSYLLAGTLCIDIHRNVDFCNHTQRTDHSETSGQLKVCTNRSTLQRGNNAVGSVTFDFRSLPYFHSICDLTSSVSKIITFLAPKLWHVQLSKLPPKKLNLEVVSTEITVRNKIDCYHGFPLFI